MIPITAIRLVRSHHLFGGPKQKIYAIVATTKTGACFINKQMKIERELAYKLRLSVSKKGEINPEHWLSYFPEVGSFAWKQELLERIKQTP